MDNAMGGGLVRVPLATARKEQLLDFAKVVGQFADDELESLTVPQLREKIGKLAVYGDTIFASAKGGSMSGPAQAKGGDKFAQPEDRRMDPDEERWFLVEIQPDYDADGERCIGQAFVCVNDEFAYIPRGLRVWIRELFYWHLRDQKTPHYKQRQLPAPAGYPPKMKTVKTFKPVYAMELCEVGGKVATTVPETRRGELLITPNFSGAQARALTLEKERELAVMEIDGEMDADEGRQAFARERAAQMAMHAEIAAAGAAG